MTPVDEALLAVASRLEGATDHLVDAQVHVLRTLPAYRRVPDDDLVRSCRRNVMRVVTTLRSEASLPPEILEDERDSGRRRALQGIPAEEVVGAYRAVLGVLRDAFLDEVAATDAPRAAVLLGIRRLWDLTDHYSSELVSARHQVDLELVRRQERDRQTFLHNMLTGTLGATELRDGGAAYGLGGGREAWVLRARAGSAAGDLTRDIDRATATRRFPPLLGVVRGDVAGVVGRPPESGPEDALIAVDGPVAVSQVHAAFVRASTLLDIGQRYGMRGVVTRERLSVRMAVAHDEGLGTMLHERYFGPLDPAAGITPLLVESVRAYLDHRRSIPATARSLNLHVNTLRYRLERFTELTGADLGDTLTLVELWWALQHARLHTAHGAHAAPR